MYASIGGVDITPYIQETSYDVNQVNVYEEWTDANYRNHREQVRTRVEGSFDLVFVKESDLSDFLTLLNNNVTTSKLLTISLSVININSFDEYEVFFEFENTSTRTISNNYFYKRFKMTLEER